MTKKKQTTNILCKIGVHDWDEWQKIEHSNLLFSHLYYYIQATVNPRIKCLKVRRCRRAGCEAREERYEHDLREEDWQYTEEKRCLQRQECRRCGEIVERQQHIWGYGYPNDNTCAQVWLCKRCGYKSITSTVASGATAAILGPENHDWGEWQYTKEESCTQVRICRRNEQHRETRENHDWGEWEYIDDDLCKQVRVCKRNNNHKDEQLRHIWEKWKYIPKDSNECVHSRKCLRCGYSEEVIEPHKWSEWQHPNASPYQTFQCEFCGQEREQSHRDAIEVQDTSPPKTGETEPYCDFNLHIAPDGHIVASSCEGEATDRIPIQVPNAIELALKLIERGQTDADLLKNVGKELYNWLFPGKIHTHFQQTEAVVRRENRKMRLRLRIEAEEIASLPLEFLYRETGGYYIALNPDTVLSRYLNLAMPSRYVRRREGPLHTLAIIADPADQTRLPPNEWEAILQEALAGPLAADQMTLQTVKQATRKNIRNALLQQKPDIIQFVGHGIYKDRKGYLALVDEKTGKTWLVDDECFANLYQGYDDHLGLISLATCESAKSVDPQGFLGIAPKLVQRGVPAVLAMQYKVLIKTAKVFLEDFYTAVAARKPIDWATQSARNAVSQELSLDNREFATPVLYMRAQNGDVF